MNFNEADMAELADALPSGGSEQALVQVQVLLSASQAGFRPAFFLFTPF